ncbi:hypothetical protein K469DRAFT_692010 [Zopfia rhizophila CBS 207.26]|uniref:Uncharacterized protein n=1 Tax=Zopfia rhizophila CBS 207.26 TaxID=1314779 RepID=A0A6A6DTN3_9PEZI|nr:hypothetical protein K469DRAFT_692010 [Zopfia rhizophila CBS 207.26]
MSPISWVFDVSSLMILIGEAEESRFRSSRLTLLETLVAAPVAGIQSYLKTYDGVSDFNRLTYLSPYGCKRAPLRNMKLDNTIRHLRLLDNGKYTTFLIKDGNSAHGHVHRSKYKSILPLWLIFTWLYFEALIVFWRLAPFRALPSGTWVGITNVGALTGWSILVRAIELVMIRQREEMEKKKSKPKDLTEPDGVIFLGNRNSALVIEGNRQAIRLWTTMNRLEYNDGNTSEIPNRHFQTFTRTGTLLVLLLVFTTVPNGSTTDQLAFILLNILGQVNVFLGLHLNAKSCLGELKPEDKAHVENRTQVYGFLIRHFKDRVDQGWIDKVGILPKTQVWDDWKEAIKVDMVVDPKKLYDTINEQRQHQQQKNDMKRQRDIRRVKVIREVVPQIVNADYVSSPETRRRRASRYRRRRVKVEPKLQWLYQSKILRITVLEGVRGGRQWRVGVEGRRCERAAGVLGQRNECEHVGSGIESIRSPRGRSRVNGRQNTIREGGFRDNVGPTPTIIIFEKLREDSGHPFQYSYPCVVPPQPSRDIRQNRIPGGR